MVKVSGENANSSLGIMQPYIFPYIGYFNLCHACDYFLFYDDVNFIKRGWVNRNRININGKAFKFTVPIKGASQNCLIADVEIDQFNHFKRKFLAQLEFEYKNAPFFQQGFEYVRSVLDLEESNLSTLAITSVKHAFEYLGIEKNFGKSSVRFRDNRELDKADRLIAITKSLGYKNYINSIGGIQLYEKEYFQKNGVNLRFIETYFKKYNQHKQNDFLAGLSIIDFFMNLPVEEIVLHVESYELV